MPFESLKIFNTPTADWFCAQVGTPTAVQDAAWPAIAAGEHTLVSAPTGTGKTLSAFLVFIDRLKAQSRAGTLKNELHLIYVSPLKSLAGDIRENLRRPLDGISRAEMDSGAASKGAPFDIKVSIRTGDTTQKERRSMIKTPPHILITTPESLYLLLTSKSGRDMLRTARAVIIDELHALIGSKRGAHLMLSIARLDKLCPQPLQRIGLSATIEPLSTAAAYLSPEPVSIAAPDMRKMIEISVTSPLPDPQYMPDGSIWPELGRVVYEHCEGARSVIAFVEGRMQAEKLAYYVNQLGGEGFARTHHASVSKERRFEVEQALRDGELRLLCATSSMELGIDVGDIDVVLQIGCPRSISSTMQRLGRAGHNPGRVSFMHIFPRTAAEGLYCGLTAKVAKDGGIEHTSPPELCLDVLAQHLVSMAAGDGYAIDDVMELLPRAYPFRQVSREDVHDVLCMLAGDYEHERDIPVRPRVLYDRINGKVEGDAYSRMLAIRAGGTIPDRGLYTVKAENGAKLGELDEEFVFEARVGDKFLLGTFAWKILSLQKDAVIVTQSNTEGAQPPFWKGDWAGRGIQTGLAFGEILRSLGQAYETGRLEEALRGLGLDETATGSAGAFLERQIKSSGLLPDDRTILVEHFYDDAGDNQMMVHSMFGRRVNAPLALLAREAAKRRAGADVGCFDDDYGFLLFPYGEGALPENILQGIKPESARSLLTAMLPATPLFGMSFRYSAARALMMGIRKTGRQPLWVQRLRGAEMLDSVIKYENHPLIRETKRECLEDYWDLVGVEQVLEGIQSGAIAVREIYLDAPSPMSLSLRREAEATLLYEYSPTTSGVYHAVEQSLEQAEMVAPAPEQLERVSERGRMPEDEKQLHSLLMIEGDLIASDLVASDHAAGELDVPIDWLEALAVRGRALYIEPGLWIAAEQAEEYSAALEWGDFDARMRIVRRAIRYRGAQSPEQVEERYFLNEVEVLEVLDRLCGEGAIIESGGLYYHAELYNRARRETVKSRRSQIKTLPPERFAALTASRAAIAAPPSEQLEAALRLLRDEVYPVAIWESALLPVRVSAYRPDLLDALLAKGGLFWRMTEEGLSFHLYEDIDWDAELPETVCELSDSERVIYEALKKRGASFIEGFSGLLDGESPHDALLSLAQKGLVHSDSFVPVRQWLGRDRIKKSTARQRVSSRVRTLTAGRWDITRPLIPYSIERLTDRAFDRSVLLCRETVHGLSWGQALEVLRVWEYTGRVRRGYFIEGLSGAQFIREGDFGGTVLALEQPRDDMIWLPATDPAQVWGKSLKHMPDRSFINVAGTAVALRAGVPVAVFERQGQVLRVFDDSCLCDALKVFTDYYSRSKVFPSQTRITVKEYTKSSSEALESAGFTRQMMDYVLYRKP